jgi:hypothetical protein
MRKELRFILLRMARLSMTHHEKIAKDGEAIV